MSELSHSSAQRPSKRPKRVIDDERDEDDEHRYIPYRESESALTALQTKTLTGSARCLSCQKDDQECTLQRGSSHCNKCESAAQCRFRRKLNEEQDIVLEYFQRTMPSRLSKHLGDAGWTRDGNEVHSTQPELEVAVRDVIEAMRPARLLAATDLEWEEHSRIMACPYSKFDPQRYSHLNVREITYRRCSSMVVRDISRLKQHLYRVHRRPEYHCPRCFSAFERQEVLDLHLRSSLSCSIEECPFPEKMSVEQSLMIKRKTFGKSEAENWFSIYDILFPESQRPFSIYVNSETEQLLVPEESHQSVFLAHKATGPGVLSSNRHEHGFLAAGPSKIDSAIDLDSAVETLDDGHVYDRFNPGDGPQHLEDHAWLRTRPTASLPIGRPSREFTSDPPSPLRAPPSSEPNKSTPPGDILWTRPANDSGYAVFDVRDGTLQHRKAHQRAPLSAEQRELAKQLRSQGACLRCRQLKIRCSFEMPCHSCSSRGVECVRNRVPQPKDGKSSALNFQTQALSVTGDQRDLLATSSSSS